MSWFRKELVIVIVLVVVTVRTEWCDVTKMQTFDATVMEGILYRVLSTDNNKLYGYNNSVETAREDYQYLEITGYNQSCSKVKTELCEVFDNYCSGYFAGKIYIIASNSRYVVTYTEPSQFSTRSIDIYIKIVDRNKVALEDLGQELLGKISDVCGEYTFHGTKLPLTDFIPGCLQS